MPERPGPHVTPTATRINDFSIEVATVNGSGSQTANNVLMRTIFQMGVPVSGKNFFPSNISGLPTWFQIRASHRGYVARKAAIDLMICMNPETAREDVTKLAPGAFVIYDEPLKLDTLRSDIVFLPVPFQGLAATACADVKLQKLVKNMVYVGVADALLGLDIEESKSALTRQLKGKQKAIDLNQTAVQVGYDWAMEHLPPQDRLKVIRDHKTEGQIILDGNAACALGALFAGVTVVAWYPITPSSSVIETLASYSERFRKDPATGKSSIAILQMEDEIASAGVVVGAGWAGARSMTATSGPGVSLMSEFIGLGYWTENPGVFINVQRTGPSTGLPTHTMQGDIEYCAKASHGDTEHPCYYPATMEECFRFTYDAFDLSERLQTPVFVMTDLDLGMQNWASQPFAYPDEPLDRGKVLNQEELAAVQDWGRYKDVDGDGICYRTLPGTAGGKGAFFTRGTGHTPQAFYSEKPEDYKAKVDRLKLKFETAKSLMPASVLDVRGSQVGILAYGSSHPAVEEARDTLREDHHQETDYLRVRAFPFTKDVQEFLASHEVVHVVDQNRDGQMASLLIDAYPEFATRIRRLRHYDSSSLSAQNVLDLFFAQTQAPIHA